MFRTLFWAMRKRRLSAVFGPPTSVLVAILILQNGRVAPVYAELYEGDGYVSLGNGGWDFSAFEFVPSYETADLSTHVVLATGQAVTVLQYLLSHGGIQAAPFGADFDSLAVAPTEGYAPEIFAYEFTNYFVRTREGHYVKVRMLQSFGLIWEFHYVYQDDGTPILEEGVSVEATTWGAVKALYR